GIPTNRPSTPTTATRLDHVADPLAPVRTAPAPRKTTSAHRIPRPRSRVGAQRGSPCGSRDQPMPYRTPRWLHLFQLEAHGHVRDRVGCRHRGATRRRYAHTIDPADPCSDDARRRQSASATTHRTIRAPTDVSCPRIG